MKTSDPEEDQAGRGPLLVDRAHRQADADETGNQDGQGEEDPVPSAPSLRPEDQDVPLGRLKLDRPAIHPGQCHRPRGDARDPISRVDGDGRDLNFHDGWIGHHGSPTS